MAGTLQSYTVKATVELKTRTVLVGKATVKNCYTPLQAKSKFDDACKAKYKDQYVSVIIESCTSNAFDDMFGGGLNNIFGKGFGDIFGGK